MEPHSTFNGTRVFIDSSAIRVTSRASCGYSTTDQRFKSVYGSSPAIISMVWTEINNCVTYSTKPYHLLHFLRLLNLYGKDNANVASEQSDKHTFPFWGWHTIGAMRNMSVVNVDCIRSSSLAAS